MKIKDNITSYEEFKYIVQDTGSIYIGAAFSYEELLTQELTPFKLKAILTHYILKETTPETTLESEFYYLQQDSFLYEVYKQLKVKIKIQQQVEKTDRQGQISVKYIEKVCSLQELTDINLARKKASGVIISEIVIPKLALMTFSV